jgi:hypothetical protein
VQKVSAKQLQRCENCEKVTSGGIAIAVRLLLPKQLTGITLKAGCYESSRLLVARNLGQLSVRIIHCRRLVSLQSESNAGEWSGSR